jgi:hypothetical protein
MVPKFLTMVLILDSKLIEEETLDLVVYSFSSRRAEKAPILDKLALHEIFEDLKCFFVE